MPNRCSCAFRPNALFFPYRLKSEEPKISGFWLAFVAQLTGIVGVFIVWPTDVELRLPETGTLVTLLGTFTIAIIGYSAWARQKLIDLRLRVSGDRSEDEAEEYQSANDLVCCVRRVSSAIRSRINMHMLFVAIAYSLLLLVFVAEESLPESWSEDVAAVQVMAVAWFIPNLILLGTVAASLNDFLDYTQEQLEKEAGK